MGRGEEEFWEAQQGGGLCCQPRAPVLLFPTTWHGGLSHAATAMGLRWIHGGLIGSCRVTVTKEEASQRLRAHPNTKRPSSSISSPFWVFLPLFRPASLSVPGPGELELSLPRTGLSLPCGSGQAALVPAGQSRLLAVESPEPQEKACVSGAGWPLSCSMCGRSNSFYGLFHVLSLRIGTDWCVLSWSWVCLQEAPGPAFHSSL